MKIASLPISLLTDLCFIEWLLLYMFFKFIEFLSGHYKTKFKTVNSHPEYGRPVGEALVLQNLSTLRPVNVNEL